MIGYILTSLFIITILYIGISLLWTFIEWILYGETYPSFTDDIIAFTLAVSLFYNIY